MSVRGLKIVQNPLNTFQTTLFRTSACRRQPSWIWKESLATALLIDIDFIMAGLAYVQHSASENCLQRAVFATYAHRWQKAALRGTEIGVNSKKYFQSVINITTLLGKRDMKLFSAVSFIEIYAMKPSRKLLQVPFHRPKWIYIYIKLDYDFVVTNVTK